MLAVWDGGLDGQGTLWHDPFNWAGDALPADGEDVTIPAAFAELQIRIEQQTVVVGALDVHAGLAVEWSTLTIDGAATLRGPLSLAANSTLTGSGDVTVVGSAEWTEGAMKGSGRTIVAEGAALQILGEGQKQLDRVLENQGGVITQHAEGVLAVGAEAAGGIRNLAGTYVLTGEAAISVSAYGGTFENQATLVHTGGGVSTLWTPLHNESGTIDVQAGSVQLAGGTVGAENVFSGTTTLVGGDVALTNGVGLQLAASSVIGGDGALVLTNGYLEPLGDVAIARLRMEGGEVRAALDENFAYVDSNLVVTEHAEWTAGVMREGGLVTIAAGATLEVLDGATKTLGRVLENRGVIEHYATDFGLGDNTAGVISNLVGATYAMHGSASLAAHNSAFNRLENTGTLRQVGAGSSLLAVPLYNADGALQIDDELILGDFQLDHHFSGTTALDGGRLTLVYPGGGSNSSRVLLAPDAQVTGSGTLVIAGGSVEPLGNAQVAHLHLAGGGVQGSGNLIITETGLWTAGQQAGAGKTIIASNAALDLAPVGPSDSGAHYLDRALENQGTIRQRAGERLWMNGFGTSTGLVRNLSNATYVLEDAAAIDDAGAEGLFENFGRIVHQGEGTAVLGATLHNLGGTIDVQQGTLALNRHRDAAIHRFTGASRLEGGALQLDNAGLIQFEPLASLAGTGTLVIGTYGTLEHLGDLAIERLELASGISDGGVGGVQGAGNLTITGSAVWSSGAMSGPGTTIVPENAALVISTAGGGPVLERRLENRGQTTLQGPLGPRTGAVIHNAASGTLTLADAAFIWAESSEAVLENAGRLIQAASGELAFRIPLHNAGGAIELHPEGALFLQSFPARFSGMTTLSGGRLVADSIDLTFADDAAMIGSGTLVMALNSSLTTSGDAAVARLAQVGQNAAIDGTGVLTITDEATWADGSMIGPGTTRIAAGATLEITGGKLQRVLENAGTINLRNATLSFGDDAPGTLRNLAGARLATWGTTRLQPSWSSTGHAVENYGTIVAVGEGQTYFTALTLDNRGGSLVSEHGEFFADYRLEYAATTHLGPEAYLRTADGSDTRLTGGLTSQSTSAGQFLPLGTLTLQGGGPERWPLEAMSEDRGPTAAGWSWNFAFGRLDLVGGVFELVDDADNVPTGATAAPEALYVEHLYVAAETTLDLGGRRAYAGSVDIQGTVVGGGVTLVPGARIPVPQVSFAAASQSAFEHAGVISVSVTMTPAPSVATSVPVVIAAESTAEAGVDYRLLNAEATFLPGQSQAAIAIEVLDDRAFEVDETLVLRLPSALGLRQGAVGVHTLTLVDNDGPPGIGFATSSQYASEGETKTVDVVLDYPTTVDVTAELVVTGTVAGEDYALSTTQVTIPAGAQRATVSVEILDDDLGEGTENLRLGLAHLAGASPTSRAGAAASHTLIVPANDAPQVFFSLSSSHLPEDGGTATIEVELSGPTTEAVSVFFGIQTRSAGNADYAIATPWRVDFSPGDVKATLEVEVVDDVEIEPNEFLTLRLFSPQNAALGNRIFHTFSIIDNEARLAEFSLASQDRWEDEGTILVNVALPAPRTDDVFFNVEVSGGRAFGNYALRNQFPGVNNDFFVANGGLLAGQPLKIPAGQFGVTIPITLIDDVRNEGTEKIVISINDRAFTTALGQPTKLGKQRSHTINIKDNDPLITLLPLGEVRRPEGTPPLPYLPPSPSPYGYLQVAMTLSAPTNRDVVVPYSVVSSRGKPFGTAQPNVDFFTQAGLYLKVPAGQTKSSTAGVAIVMMDALDEGDETIVAQFGPVSGGGILKSSNVTYTILDDDATPVAYFATSNRSLSERNQTQNVTVALTSRSASDVYVPISFGGKALYGSDYFVFGLDSAGRLKIPAGHASASFSFKTFDDSRVEGSESVVVTMGRPTNALASSKASSRTRTFTVLDDDVQSCSTPTVSQAGPLNINTTGCSTNVGGGTVTADASSVSLVPNAQGETVLLATNGTLQDTTVFLDANFNGAADYLDLDGDGVQNAGEPDEPLVATGLDGLGTVELAAALDRNGDGQLDVSEGRWVALGGVDASTGLAWRLPLAAPLGMQAVTPLSTLVESLVRWHGFDPVDAQQRVLEALGIAGADLASTNLPAAIAAGDAQAAAAYARLVQVSNTALGMADLYAGAADALPFPLLADQAFRALAERIAAFGTTLDLTIDAVLLDALQAVGFSTGAMLDADPTAEQTLMETAATILAAGNAALASAEPTGDLAFLTYATQVKQVLQGAVAPALRELAAGTLTSAEALAQFTGENLAAAIAAAPVYQLAPVTVAVSDAAIVEGTGGTTWLEFTIALEGARQTPVTVDYALLSGTATLDDGDYAPAAGQLTWPVGDDAPRTVQVEVASDDRFELDEWLALVLENVTGATYARQIGYGLIVDEDAGTLAASDAGDALYRVELDATSFAAVVQDEIVHVGPRSEPLALRVEGTDQGADVLTIDLDAADFRSDAVEFAAGAGSAVDQIRWEGGAFDAIVHEVTGDGPGAAQWRPVDSQAELDFAWEHVEEFVLKFSSVDVLTLEFAGDAGAVVIVDADPTDAQPELAGMLRITSAAGAFAPLLVRADIGTLQLQGLAAADVTIESLDPLFSGAIDIVPPAGLPGDFDGDGAVGTEDFVVWSAQFGTVDASEPIPGDADGDFDVDGFDLLAWQRNFGTFAAAVASTAAAVTAPTEFIAPTTVVWPETPESAAPVAESVPAAGGFWDPATLAGLDAAFDAAMADAYRDAEDDASAAVAQSAGMPTRGWNAGAKGSAGSGVAAARHLDDSQGAVRRPLRRAAWSPSAPHIAQIDEALTSATRWPWSD